MRNIKQSLFIIACVTSSLALQGCGMAPISDADAERLTDETVVRATVNWTEKANSAYSPASYSVQGNYFHWVKANNQYRWIPIKAIMRKEKWGSLLRTARIADGVPLLKTGDWVDVYIPTFKTMDYSANNSAVILRLVCDRDDSACKEKSTKELGGKNEVVHRGRPDMSAYTFTKKFDVDGNLLK